MIRYIRSPVVYCDTYPGRQNQGLRMAYLTTRGTSAPDKAFEGRHGLVPVY